METGCESVDRWADGDGDGFGAGPSEVGCPEDAGWAAVALDCDDEDDAVHPDVEEECNGQDDDCNGLVDDELKSITFYSDVDGDGFGVRYPSQVGCISPGDGWVRNVEDCNDEVPEINPDGREICNGGIDDDCNGVADDNDAGVAASSLPRWYADNDADGYGDADQFLDRCLPQADYVENATDCNDNTRRISPGDAETPGDGIDQNCNNLEGCYDDLDNDDARTENWTEVADLQCDDLDHAPARFPVDCDDANPLLTEDVGWYVDVDGDGYGAGELLAFQCSDPGGGLVQASDPLDCDEGDPNHGPQTPEICDDGTDQNCDRRVDCADPDCETDALCLLPCADENIGDQPGTITGSTSGAGNDSGPLICGYSSAPELAYQWVAPSAGLWTFDTMGSSFDTILYLRSGCIEEDLVCNDDAIGVQSQVQWNATEGEVLVIYVDGYSTNEGNFVLNIY